MNSTTEIHSWADWLKLFARSLNKVLRNPIFVGSLVLCQPGCAHLGEDENLTAIRAALQEYQALCYERAFETINRPALGMKLLVMSPPSGVKDSHGHDLFFMWTPAKWGGVEIVRSIGERSVVGAFELRYTYVPITKLEQNAGAVFYGLRQQIFDLEKNELIAERFNIAATDDFPIRNFRRTGSCLTPRDLISGWYSGNDEFASRVLGNKYAKPGESIRTAGPPEWHVRAELLDQKKVSITLPSHNEREFFFEGGYYAIAGWQLAQSTKEKSIDNDTNLARFLKNPPYYFMTLVRHESGIVAVAFPNGNVRNRPPREVLFLFVTKEFEEVGRLYAQIPPGMDWIDGWGFNPAEVVVSKSSIDFRIYGEKRRTSKYSDQGNEGHYSSQYLLRVAIPSSASTILTQN